jgi:hypothetical protein
MRYKTMTNMIVRGIDPAVKADINMVCDEEGVSTLAKALEIIMIVYREKQETNTNDNDVQ